jgi:hypothetical protein
MAGKNSGRCTRHTFSDQPGRLAGGRRGYASRKLAIESAEIAKREGFPYFTVTKVGDYQAPVYSGYKYVGAMTYITVRMRGWRAYEERCRGDNLVRSSLRCDLYSTQKTLESYKN